MYAARWTVPARTQYDELKAAADQAFDRRRGKGKSTDAEGLFKQVHGCIAKLLQPPASRLTNPQISLTDTSLERRRSGV